MSQDLSRHSLEYMAVDFFFKDYAHMFLLVIVEFWHIAISWFFSLGQINDLHQ